MTRKRKRKTTTRTTKPSPPSPAASPTTPSSKEVNRWLVMQKGGTSAEWYANWFDSASDAEAYRVDAGEHTWDTQAVQEVKFPAGMTDEQINMLCQSFGEVAEALLAEAFTPVF